MVKLKYSCAIIVAPMTLCNQSLIYNLFQINNIFTWPKSMTLLIWSTVSIFSSSSGSSLLVCAWLVLVLSPPLVLSLAFLSGNPFYFEKLNTKYLRYVKISIWRYASLHIWSLIAIWIIIHQLKNYYNNWTKISCKNKVKV